MAKKLSFKTKMGFGVCDMGGNLFFTAIGFWSLYYLTDVVSLGAAAAGFAIMIGKFWDAVTDPAMGYISDRTKSKMGRRRPYILFGSIPLFLSMWFFFTNPQIESQTLLTIWAVFALCFLNTAFTVVNIPYSSLTPELTKDYHEQSSLNGFRFSFAVVGTILGAAIVLPILSLFSNESKGFSVVGFIMGLVMLVTALITVFSVKENPPSLDTIPKESFFKTYSAVFKNRAYLLLIITYALNVLALNLLQGILVYYFEYVLHAKDQTQLALVILLLVTMITIAPTVFLSKKIGKRLTYQLGLGIIAIGCLIIFLLGHIFGYSFVYVIMFFIGIGLGIAFAAPWAMVPDTVEWDAIQTGERKEGIYYGMWTFFSKVGQALSIGFMGLLLNASGYLPNIMQGEKTIFVIRLLVGPIPAFIFLLAILTLAIYPITEKVYNEMMKGKETS
ncbi:MAG: glycoside-pentoside-hexuronide (GPH):cation symporter [Spirochaetota bacterium]|jgi:GPH family glycoside/pentoside/hexuronide:cation symporter|nr:glycoside-pentoside-hexuronide (GPH):cation symporter [Spirochaetota bacterium]NMA56871.1 MFS transporter [Treponema sp.]